MATTALDALGRAPALGSEALAETFDALGAAAFGADLGAGFATGLAAGATLRAGVAWVGCGAAEASPPSTNKPNTTAVSAANMGFMRCDLLLGRHAAKGGLA